MRRQPPPARPACVLTNPPAAFSPVVSKKHDDQFLRRANENIGERPCINGDRCLANFIGRVRFGADTDKCFTCTEFLLPDQLERFKAGKGLPATRGKCLLCARCAALPNVEFCLHCPHANCSSLHRYYQNYLYILVNACPYPQCHYLWNRKAIRG